MRTLRAEGLLEHHNPFTGYPVLQYLPWGRGPDHQSAKVTHQVTTVVGPFTGRHCEKKYYEVKDKFTTTYIIRDAKMVRKLKRDCA